jgi:hypothetical protein
MSLFEPFAAWEAADFDAFAEPKWRSNRFNLERARVRHRLLSLVDQALTAAALDRAGLDIWSSLDHPALVNDHAVRQQTVLLCRSAAQREEIEARDPAVSASAPDFCHIHVGLVVDACGLTLQFHVPAGARQEQAFIAQAFDDLNDLAETSPGFEIRIDNVGVDSDTFLTIASTSVCINLSIALRADRSLLCSGAWQVVDIAAWLVRFLPVLRRALASCFDSKLTDSIHLDSTNQSPQPHAPQPASANARTTGPVSDGRGYRPFGRRPPAHKIAPPPPPKAAKVGSRVRLVTGAFEGKIGTVTAIQGGQIVVALGLLTAKVAPQDVKVL